jgi:iron transport multicopper oxidase
MRRICAASAVCALLFAVFAGQALGSGVTNSGDDLRTGWYPDEPSLTPQLISGGTFGQLWSTPVSGQVYAQPLLANGTLLVATENNLVYGLNPVTGALKWGNPLSLGTPWRAADIGCGDLAPTIGVTATPVIDMATNTAYMTHKTYAAGIEGEARWYMDAIDLSSGAEQPGFPVALEGSAQNAPGQSFHPTTELQRPGLLLMDGVVYAAFGSDCDHPPWQGWVFGVSTAGIVKARWVSVASSSGAGIWQSGAGLTSDGSGRILLSTGNGGAPATPTPGNTPPANLGESVVRLDVQGDGSLKADDFFAPFDASSLDGWDADFASGGVTGLPSAYFGTPTIPDLAVAVGKQGYVYLLNRDNLGGIGQGASGSDNVMQRIGPYGGVWSRPGVWPGDGGWVYIPTASGGTSASGSSGNLRVYEYGRSGSGAPTLSLQGTSTDAFGFSSSAPIITSDGITSGSALVWTVWAPNGSGSGAQLRAYDPIPVEGHPVLRWSAPVGTSAKFAVPGVGEGRIYVGTRDGHVLGFGSPVTPVLTGPTTAFPTTTEGKSVEKTVTLEASEALTLSRLSSSSLQFTVGEASPALPATLAAGQTIAVPITFTPTGTGPIAATLTAETTSGKTATFELSGTGQAAAALLEATPPAVTFGGTTIGGHLSGSATFRNVGGQPLTIESVREPAAPFSAVGVPKVGSTIAPGGSITVTVSFDPTSKGIFSDEIGLDTTGGSSSVGLSGSADEPGRLEIESESTDYGPVPIGASVTRAFTIKNAGATAVTITKSKPPIGGAFAAITSLPEGTTIAAGESLREEVSFAPTGLGQARGEWVVNGNDTTGLHNVLFQGRGVEARPPVTATGAASAVTQTTATLNATVNPAGEALSDCRFEYGPTSAYGKSVPCSTTPSPGEAPVAVSATITGLAPNSTYYFRVLATNATATAHGGEARLTTLPLLLAPTPLGGETLQVLNTPIVSAAVPRVKLLRRSLVAGRGGKVTVTLSCPTGVGRCVGSLILRTQIVVLSSAGRRSSRNVVLAGGAFSLGGGQFTSLHLHLSAQALRLLLRSHPLHAQMTITAQDSSGVIYRTKLSVTIAPKGRK